MQPLRGTRDILPNEMQSWQYIHNIANKILNQNNYKEVQTPIIENTELFTRSIGNFTDIVNKEMYSFCDQSNRNITLRPEGTASIARAIISNKLYVDSQISRLWYMGPMFRYERPQKGRQRQFHQLGIECIGSFNPIADVEVIKLAIQVLSKLGCISEYELDINCIGNIEERELYKVQLVEYLHKYKDELDNDSKTRLNKNPLRILDSKNTKTQEILQTGPILKNYLNKASLDHFNQVCEHLEYLQISYNINNYLVRGLDYYNYTAFEIKTKTINSQNTVCGGGRYDRLIEQLGGPNIPAVGWAIGIERILILANNYLKTQAQVTNTSIYVAVRNDNYHNSYMVWDILNILEEYNIKFELDLSNSNLSRQIKKASRLKATICLILGENENYNKFVTIKWLNTGMQQQIHFVELKEYMKYIKKTIIT